MTPSRIDFAIKSYANSTRRSRRLPVASPYAAQKNSRLANRLRSLMTIEFQTTGSSNCSLDENAFIYKSLAQHQSSKVQLVIVHCCCCCLYLVNKATESDISRSEIQFWITIFIYLSVPTIVISHTVVPNCVYSYLCWYAKSKHKWSATQMWMCEYEYVNTTNTSEYVIQLN